MRELWAEFAGAPRAQLDDPPDDLQGHSSKRRRAVLGQSGHSSAAAHEEGDAALIRQWYSAGRQLLA